MLCPAAEESRADRAQAQRLSPVRRRATAALFSLCLRVAHTRTRKHNTCTDTCTCLRTWTRSHFFVCMIFMLLNPIPLWSTVRVECVCERVKKRVSFQRVITLGTLGSAGVVTESKLERSSNCPQHSATLSTNDTGTVMLTYRRWM